MYQHIKHIKKFEDQNLKRNSKTTQSNQISGFAGICGAFVGLVLFPHLPGEGC
jgi:hypothetical protein